MWWLLFAFISNANAEEIDLKFPTNAKSIAWELMPKRNAVSRPVCLTTPQTRGMGGIIDDKPRAGAMIQFDFDSSDIKPESYPLLDEYAAALKTDLKEMVISIAGHTDSDGSDDYNVLLSQKRARAVQRYLIEKHQILSQKLRVESFGKHCPIVSNDSILNKAKNRRVEFINVGSIK